MAILIADSGSTKCEWCFISNGRKQFINTQGASPYFLNELQLVALMQNELLPALKKNKPARIFIFMEPDVPLRQTGPWCEEPLKKYFREPG